MNIEETKLDAQGNCINPLLPAVAVLKIRKFRAKLPDDFAQLISVETEPSEKTFLRVDNNRVIGKVRHKTHDTFMYIPTETEMMYRSMDNRLNRNAFFIRKNEILFMGNYSKNVFVRWMQLLKEWIAPQKVILKYIDYERWKSHCR
jgi:hypothetical protein